MGFALSAQRWGTAAASLLALLWGGWAWGATAGLWLAVWIVGLSCLGIGATLHEIGEHRHRQGWPPPSSRARDIKLSGFGYLSVGMVAGWFHPVLTLASLGLALADFLAGHPMIRRLSPAAEPPR